MALHHRNHANKRIETRLRQPHKTMHPTEPYKEIVNTIENNSKKKQFAAIHQIGRSTSSRSTFLYIFLVGFKGAELKVIRLSTVDRMNRTKTIDI